MENKVEITGIATYYFKNSLRISHIIKSVFDSKLEVNKSDLFQEVMLLSDKDLTDDKLDKLIKNKVNQDTLYFILDDFPEKVIKLLKKDNLISYNEEVQFNILTTFRKRYLDIYNYVVSEQITNIKLVSLVEPNYIETILNMIKDKFNI